MHTTPDGPTKCSQMSHCWINSTPSRAASKNRSDGSEQLQHVLDVAALPNVTVQLLPFQCSARLW